MHNDGEGLYLHVSPTGAKSWILRTVVHSRRRDIGLGSASLVSLAEAREAARRLRKIARAGGDPLAQRGKETLTFAEAAKRVHAILARMEPAPGITPRTAFTLETMESRSVPPKGGGLSL